MSLVHRRGRADVQANLTPMIDVTFLLIVFFVLVSQIVESESVPMELPSPADPRSIPPGEAQRAVINVVPGAGGRAAGYRLGSRTHPAGDAGVGALAEQLARLYAGNPDLDVNLRADRGTEYRDVRPVLEAVAAAAAQAGTPGPPRLNLVVSREN